MAQSRKFGSSFNGYFNNKGESGSEKHDYLVENIDFEERTRAVSVS